MVVAQLENHSLPRGEIGEGTMDAFAEFPGEEAALRVVVRTILLSGFQEIELSGGGLDDGRIFLSHFSLPEVIEADIRYDAVQPGGEIAVESERMQIFENAEERLLIHVFGLFGGPEQVQGNAEDRLIVRVNEAGEGVLVALLGGTDQGRFVHVRWRLHRRGGDGLFDHQQ